MGTPTPARWTLILLALLFAALALATPAAATGPVAAPFVTDDLELGDLELDGVLEERVWGEAARHTLSSDGTLRPETKREIDLRLAHNGTHLFAAVTFTPGGGTHEGDFVVVTFAPGQDASARGARDLLRYGWPAADPLTDRFWDGEQWTDDTEAGCVLQGDGARFETDGTWTFELVKPLTGDGCDIAGEAGNEIGFRVEVRENMPAPQHGDNFRWPRGTTYLHGNTDGWGTLHLLGDGEEVPHGSSDASRSSSDTAEADTRAAGVDGGSGASRKDAGSADATDTESGEAPLPANLAAAVLLMLVLARVRRRSR